MIYKHVINLLRVSAFFGHLQTGIINRHVGGLCVIVSNYIVVVGMYHMYGNLSYCTKHG